MMKIARGLCSITLASMILCSVSFIWADTAAPGKTDLTERNRYSYVQNNPMDMTDPTGHNPEALCSTIDIDQDRGLPGRETETGTLRVQSRRCMGAPRTAVDA